MFSRPSVAPPTGAILTAGAGAFALARIYETTQLRRVAGLTELAGLERLTPREAEVLELVACGLTNAAIAERLWIAAGTVKKHLDNIYAKLDVTNRTAAAARIGHKPGAS